MTGREQFEDIIRSLTDPARVEEVLFREGDGYEAYATLLAWETFKASRRAALEEAATVADQARSRFSNDGFVQQAAGAWYACEEIRALAASDSDGGKDE